MQKLFSLNQDLATAAVAAGYESPRGDATLPLITQVVTDVLRYDAVGVRSGPFGAVGDGVADDTAAIAAAIATGAGEVYLPAGVYRITTPLVLRSGLTFRGAGMGISTILADAASEMADVLYGTGLSNVHLRDFSVNVNGPARDDYTGTMSGITVTISTHVTAERVEVYGALGSTAPSSANAFSFAQVTRGRIGACIARACGTESRPSDGFYTGPNDQMLIVGCTAKDCADTAFVLESCNASGIVGCTAVGCRVGGAISAAFDGDCYGNFIDGLTIYDWNSAVVGGLYVRTTGTGSLYDTRISGVTMRRTTGSGPAVQVLNQSPSTAVIHHLTLSDITVVGAGTQGFLIGGASGRVTRYVEVNNCRVYGELGASAFQVNPFVADIRFANPTAIFAAGASAIGIYAIDAVRCVVDGGRILGDGANVTHGVFFDGTNSDCAVLGTSIDGVTVERVGADTLGTVQVALWLNNGAAGQLQIGTSAVLRDRQPAVATVAGTAGGAYTSAEQDLLNDAVTAINALIARLDSSTGHGLIT